jgi:hypothetical protein
MSPQTHPNSAETTNETYPARGHRRSSGTGTSIALLLLVIALAGAMLEYFGVINLIPNFGRRGRPYIELGSWQPAKFSDVPDNYWASPYINDLAQRGVIKGLASNQFHPAQPITRAQFASMLQAAFDSTPTPRFIRSIESFFSPNPAGQFQDVPQDFWAAPAIADAVDTGFLSGFPNNEFHPTQPVSRVNALVAIANGLNLTASSRNAIWFYQDAPQIPDYAKEAVAAATEAGIRLRQSEPPLLRPNQNLTRAEAAVLIDRALQQQAGQ